MATPKKTTSERLGGIVKQVLSGDTVVIRQTPSRISRGKEIQISFSGVNAPKLARRPGTSNENGDTKDEPWAWEAREFLRKKLIDQVVYFQYEVIANSGKNYGTLYFGSDPETAENITETLVSEGLVSVREGGRPNSEISRLTDLENAAKAAGKGKWSDSPPANHIRDIKWTIENPMQFVEKNAGKTFKAIIEHVRDGSTVRALLLPDFYYVTVMMAGIRCSGFKIDESGKPIAEQADSLPEVAKFFVEVRLLQQEVDITLHSVNKTIFVGTISHPKGNIAEILLMMGFAKCVDWLMPLVPKNTAKKFRAAEESAKKKRLRIWQDYEDKSPQISDKDKKFTATVVEVINGDALNVKLVNGTVKKIFLSSIKSPRETNRNTNDDDGKSTQRTKIKPLYDIPWMFDAREYLRKKLIGKKVQVVVDYIQEARDNFPEKTCATVLINGKNVAEALVSRGLATVVRYKQDDDQKSCYYDDLLKAEGKAEKSQVGLYSKKDTPTLRVTEVDAARAKLHLQFFGRVQKAEVVVEFVATGSRLRVYIPKLSCLCTLLLAGISCPKAPRGPIGNMPAIEGEEYGSEALQFTKERVLQKEGVTVQIDSHDKVGNFIGWLFINDTNISVELVKAGLASVHFTGEKSIYAAQLKQAEEKAKAQKLKIWKNYVKEEPKEKNEEEKVNVERGVRYEEVIVTEITPEGHFYAQKVVDGPKLEELLAKFRQEFEVSPPLPGAYTPRKGDICAAQFSLDNEWYRVKVEKVQSGKAEVFYIDYGNRETLPTTKLASLPAAYSGDKPFATEYVIPYASLPTDEEFRDLALKYLREDTNVPKLYLNVEFKYQGMTVAASLHKDNSGNLDIFKGLISEGLLIVDNFKPKKQIKLLESYKEAQDEAKKKHLNIWEYGDITADDAKEFGLGKYQC